MVNFFIEISPLPQKDQKHPKIVRIITRIESKLKRILV